MRSTPVILIVEDDEAVADSLSTNLRDRGFKVIVTANTMRALDELDRDPTIALLLLDIVMPKGQPSGMAVGRMARLRNPGIKIIYMSGYGDASEFTDQLNGKFFAKPLNLEALEREIRTQFAVV
jgi:DNA-binding NtrC family response regulator